MLRVLATLGFTALADFRCNLCVARQVSRILRSQFTESAAHHRDFSGTYRALCQRLISTSQHLNAMAHANVGRA
jgi:hypothetical protein